jgi:hypothetical protein
MKKQPLCHCALRMILLFGEQMRDNGWSGDEIPPQRIVSDKKAHKA